MKKSANIFIQARKNSGLSQKQMINQLNLSQPGISYVENTLLENKGLQYLLILRKNNININDLLDQINLK